MRQLLVVFFITVSSFSVMSQTRIILKDKDGHVTDTVNTGSLDFISNDTLTRFILGKASSPDRCSSFSISRHLYAKEHGGFRQVEKRTITMGSTCSSLWNNNAYCLHLDKLEVRNGTVLVVIKDSDDKKLKIKIEGDRNFESRLKQKVDKFISRTECNGVQIK